MRIVNCEQGTPEWLQARAGNVTASRIADVMAKIKSGEAAGRRNYRAQIVAERLTGQPADDGYVSFEMKRGTELEPFARAAYEMARDVMVEQVGFVLHHTIFHYGASPDGLVGLDGGVEIKCPNIATHLEYLKAGVVPAVYEPQMLCGMDCCERDWWDFVSYCKEMPPHLQLFIRRLARDERRIAAMRDEVLKFQSEVEAELLSLEKVVAYAAV